MSTPQFSVVFFDPDFKNASEDFFDQIKFGQFDLVTSDVVQKEIISAPQEVKDFFNAMLPLEVMKYED